MRPPPSDPSKPGTDRAQPPSPTGAGQAHALGAAGAAPLLEAAWRERRSGTLELEGPWQTKASLYLQAGRVVDAVAGNHRGLVAALRVFLWTEARFRWLVPGSTRQGDFIGCETEAIITEGLRQRAVWQRMKRELPPQSARFAVDFSELPGQLAGLPVAARELCRLCDGSRTLGEVLRDTIMPDLEAASTIGHLIGIKVLVVVPEAAPATPRIPPGDEIPAVGPDSDTEETDLVAPIGGRPRRRFGRQIFLGAAIGVGAAIALSFASPRPAPPRSAAQPPAAGGLPAVAANQAAPPSRPPSASARPAPPLPALPMEQQLNIGSVSAPASPAEPAPLAAPAREEAPPPPLTGQAAPRAPAPNRAPDRARLLAACDRARARGGQAQAVAACERAIDAGAERGDILALSAQRALERGQFGKAAARARRAVALDSKLAEAYAYLGFAEAEEGRRREAMVAYRQYLALAPRGRYAEDVRAILRDEAGKP